MMSNRRLPNQITAIRHAREVLNRLKRAGQFIAIGVIVIIAVIGSLGPTLVLHDFSILMTRFMIVVVAIAIVSLAIGWQEGIIHGRIAGYQQELVDMKYPIYGEPIRWMNKIIQMRRKLSRLKRVNSLVGGAVITVGVGMLYRTLFDHGFVFGGWGFAGWAVPFLVMVFSWYVEHLKRELEKLD